MRNKTTKTAVADTKKQKTSINWAGLPTVVVLVAEIIAVYTLTTQDNRVLIGVGAVLGLDVAWKLASKFMVQSNS